MKRVPTSTRWLPARPSGLALVAMTMLVAGCVHVFQGIDVRPIDMSVAEPTTVQAPVRVHLEDGSVIVFPDGVMITPTTLRGEGLRQNALREGAVPVTTIAVDSVLGLERFEPKTNAAASVVGSMLATAVIAGLAFIPIAVFTPTLTVRP